MLVIQGLRVCDKVIAPMTPECNDYRPVVPNYCAASTSSLSLLSAA
jgi:hypothetical protein